MTTKYSSAAVVVAVAPSPREAPRFIAARYEVSSDDFGSFYYRPLVRIEQEESEPEAVSFATYAEAARIVWEYNEGLDEDVRVAHWDYSKGCWIEDSWF